MGDHPSRRRGSEQRRLRSVAAGARHASGAAHHATGRVFSLEFQIQILSESPFGNPIDELVGYNLASCNTLPETLVSSGAQSSWVAPICITPDFDCYQTRQGGTPQEPVDLKDRFTETMDIKLGNLHRVCTPTNLNEKDPDAVTRLQHLTGYELPKKTVDANVDVMVSNSSFGSVQDHVGKARRLLVPAAKAIGKDVDPGSIPPDVSHFQCYDFTADVADFTATLQDQFSVLLNPQPVAQGFVDTLLLCVPVDKNGENPEAVNDPNAMLCYHRIKPKNVKLPQELKASTRDQFQLDQDLKVDEFQELCVTSTVAIVP